MKEKILSLVNSIYPISSVDVGEYASIESQGMLFHTEKYAIDGIGFMSYMTAKDDSKGMKMDVVVVTSLEKDMPLLSYDRVYAGGKDMIIVELYNTCLKEFDSSIFAADKNNASDIFDIPDNGTYWYDEIRYKESIKKAGSEAQSERIDEVALGYFKTFFENAKFCSACDIAEKKAAVGSYSTNLVEHGGLATDIWVKSIGKEKTLDFFKKVLFSA